ncbi:MFS transporter [Shewanella sp. WXL01]|uniref:glycoside-pentoside-hexuronide (GPH):cation symporter n=1 Tax=Shewanella sp. WXL01 TaxID=2709721 RepID=UPI00143844B6|nr:glycoside-pentoside-hexuronide (GPH):cation symporter [Shewanella sp. WXL01]NKF51409.1 MFS transporter [Shewanella sp. WXL01]
MLTVREKVAYGLGDTASNIVFQVVVNFMVFFYTDVFGISAAAAGTLMLAVRMLDAVTDPVMGGLADRTRSRFGRYRPYLLYCSIPYAILAVLAFSTPDLSENTKLVYAYVTYAALMTVYTVINIPYAALGGVLSDDPKERASIQSYRFALAMTGGAIVTALTLPMVEYFGNGDEAYGFTMALGVLSAFAVVCFLVCFAFTKERTEQNTSRSQVTASMWQDLASLRHNEQFLMLLGAAFFLLVLVSMRGAVAPYYVTYFLGREDLVSTFITSGMLASLAGALATMWLSQRVCKVKLFHWGTLGIIVFHALMYFVPADQLLLCFALMMIAQFSQMIVVPLMFSMVPDTADYGALNTGRRIMGMSYSAHLLAIKFGLAIGGATVGWLLSYFGYVANAEQTPHALHGIVLIFTLVSAVCGIGVYLSMRSYRLTEQNMLQLVEANR